MLEGLVDYFQDDTYLQHLICYTITKHLLTCVGKLFQQLSYVHDYKFKRSN